LNQRPSGYEPDELPDCSTPRRSHQHTSQTTSAGKGSTSAWSLSGARSPALADADGSHRQAPHQRDQWSRCAPDRLHPKRVGRNSHRPPLRRALPSTAPTWPSYLPPRAAPRRRPGWSATERGTGGARAPLEHRHRPIGDPPEVGDVVTIQAAPRHVGSPPLTPWRSGAGVGPSTTEPRGRDHGDGRRWRDESTFRQCDRRPQERRTSAGVGR
jgi:hypothetical protein